MKTYLPGTRIEEYEIVGGPMMGAVGLVYSCLDHSNHGRPVALKTFKPKFLSNREERDRFLREGTTWVDLASHPHIVRCYDVKYIDPTVYLILELVKKEVGLKDASLRTWIKIKGSMPVGEALFFALQIAYGMQYATEKVPGLVHRYLKPANVLVGVEKIPGTNINLVRVTDFGLAAINQENIDRLGKDNRPGVVGRVHLTHGPLGTPLYRAPEQWVSEPVGAYTDIYALGCILHELLTGQTAASGFSLDELQVQHCNGNLRPVPEDIPKPVRAFLMRCLAVTTTERYQKWDHVTTELSELCAGLGVETVPLEIGQEDDIAIDHHSVVTSYNHLGTSYAHMGQIKLARDSYFVKALGIARKIGDKSGEGSSLRNLGNANIALGDVKSAIGYYQKYLEIAREIENRRGEGNALGNLGEAYRNLGDVRNSIDYYEQSLGIAREIDNKRGEGIALDGLGLAYGALGEMDQAIGYYEQSLEIARGIRDGRGEGATLGNLGNAYMTLGKIDDAIRSFQLSLKKAQEIGDRIAEGNALGNLGGVYLTRGDVQGAIDQYYIPRLKIAREVGDKRGECIVLGNLGVAYSHLGKVEEAINNFQLSLEIAREIGDKERISSALFNLGRLYRQNGDIEVSFRMWVDLYVFAKQMNLNQALQRLAELAPKIGLPEGLKGWEMLAQRK